MPYSLLIFIIDLWSVLNNHNVSIKVFADDIKLYSSTDVSADYLSEKSKFISGHLIGS